MREPFPCANCFQHAFADDPLPGRPTLGAPFTRFYGNARGRIPENLIWPYGFSEIAIFGVPFKGETVQFVFWLLIYYNIIYIGNHLSK